MTGKATKNQLVPFFWTNQFDITLAYAGHAQTWDEIIIDGDVLKKDFIAYYVKDKQVVAVAACNRDQLVNRFEETLRSGKLPQVDKKIIDIPPGGMFYDVK